MLENEKWALWQSGFGFLGYQQTLDAWQGKGKNLRTGRGKTGFKGTDQLG